MLNLVRDPRVEDGSAVRKAQGKKRHLEVRDRGARKLTGEGIRSFLVRVSVQLRIVGRKIPGDSAVIAITAHAVEAKRGISRYRYM